MLDNLFKWFEIPYSEAQPHLQKSKNQIDIEPVNGITSVNRKMSQWVDESTRDK